VDPAKRRMQKQRRHLTQAIVASLGEPEDGWPDKGYYLVYDDKIDRLAVAVHRTGGKRWKFLYNRRGTTRWHTIGDAERITVAEARKRGYELADRVAKGFDPQAEAMEERLADSFYQLTRRYAEEYAEDNLKSWDQGYSLLLNKNNRYVPKSFHELKASAVTRRDVKAVIGRLRAKPGVARQVLAWISMVFKWAVEDAEIVAVNPCRGIDRPKTRKRERVLSDSELPLFWNAFGRRGEAGLALKVLLLTGQRPGEVAGMRREDVVAHPSGGGHWTMPGDPVPEPYWKGTKNGRSHQVWLTAEVMRLISTGGGVEGAVFSVNRRAMTDAMAKISRELNVKPATSHDLRRTHGSTITRLLGFGGREAMNRIQNHAEGGIADIYDRHRYEAETRRVMEMVAAHITGVIEGRDAGDKVVVGDFGRQ
jgi:integrase